MANGSRAHTAFQKWGHGKAKDRKKHLLKIASPWWEYDSW
jgi:hypothetical protein